MGTNLKDLLLMKEVDFDFLKGKILIVDSFNVLYQFLTTIRQRDGTLLKDSQGRVTSHLNGLFTRTTKLMKLGIMPGFVFDGKPPELKIHERERRTALKEEAAKKFEQAAASEDIESMKKFAARTSRLTGEMIEESKRLIAALGLPVIQAASEGEAQMSYIVKQGQAFAGVSEDYDSLLYGIPNLIKNLTISGKRKVKATYVTIKPKIINFSDNINHLGIDQDQLIALAMLVGTDYNYGGVKGIGPKNALKLIKEFGTDFDSLFKKVKWDDNFDMPWTDIFYTFKKMPVNTDYDIKFRKVNKEEILQLLVDEHEFSAERIESSVNELLEIQKESPQKGLGNWI